MRTVRKSSYTPHTHIRTHIHTYIHTYSRAYPHTHTHTYTSTHTYTPIHILTYTSTHTYIPTHSLMHRHIHTSYIQTCTYTQTFTHTCTHTLGLSRERGRVMDESVGTFVYFRAFHTLFLVRPQLLCCSLQLHFAGSGCPPEAVLLNMSDHIIPQIVFVHV